MLSTSLTGRQAGLAHFKSRKPLGDLLRDRSLTPKKHFGVSWVHKAVPKFVMVHYSVRYSGYDGQNEFEECFPR